jgi:parallel beta-helix repeat protein
MKRVVSTILLVILLTSMLYSAFKIVPAARALTVIVPDDYETIQEAVNNVASGDTVYVRAGTYDGGIQIEKNISLVGEGSSTTIIDGSGTGNVLTIHGNLLTNTTQVSLSGFCIRNARDCGLQIEECSSCILRNNDFLNNTYNVLFEIFQPYQSYLSLQDIDTSNTVDGKPIYYLVNEHDREIPADAGFVAIINSTNITARNLLLENNGQGLLMAFSSNCRVENVTARHNLLGISIDSSSCNMLTDNHLSSNEVGIRLEYSSDNVLRNNIVMSNNWGIEQLRSYNNSFHENNMTSNVYNFGTSGFILDHFVHEIDTSNTVDGKLIYYFRNQEDLLVTTETCPNIGLLIVSDSRNITVSNLTLSNNGIAITLAFTNNSIIENNELSGNYYAIWLQSSCYNTIKMNHVSGSIGCAVVVYATAGSYATNNTIICNMIDTIENSGNGIMLARAVFNNKIFHNSFVNVYPPVELYRTQGTNAWDDGYPSGGNYWSDYSDFDLYSGLNQNEPGSDGIWDHPYVIDANNQDNYPLVSPWTPTPTYVQGIDVSHYQGTIDWPQVFGAGYRFAFAKASEGDEWSDSTFGTNMVNGRNAGLFMGAYHLGRPDLGTSAHDEAHFFVDTTYGYLTSGYLRPVLRISTGSSMGKEALSNWIVTWVEEVRSLTNAEPLIQVTSEYANYYLDTSLSQYDLWISHWTYDPAVPPNTGEIWDTWSFWQYSNLGSVPGIDGDVFLDLFNGDNDGLQKMLLFLPPEADFTYSPKKPLIMETITFDASSSYDPNGRILLYAWSATDGQTYLSQEPTWETRFTRAGEYTVTLEVVDNDNQRDTKSFRVKATEDWTFAIITDIHMGYDYEDYGTLGWNDAVSDGNYQLTTRLSTIVNWINEHEESNNIHFVAVLGDISDSGEKSELIKARDILNGLNVPYIPVIGNHDIWPYTQLVDDNQYWRDLRLTTAIPQVSGPTINPDYPRTRPAIGDQFFNEIFWQQNNENREKIEKLFGDSFRRQTDPIEYEYIQNYVFTYKGIKFIALDFIDRNPTEDTQSAGAKLNTDTEWWLGVNLSPNEKTILLSHHPMFYDRSLWGAKVGFSKPEAQLIGQIIKDSGAVIIKNFAGHTHITSEVSKGEGTEIGVVIGEAVCRESCSLTPGISREKKNIRLVTMTLDRQMKSYRPPVKIVDDADMDIPHWSSNIWGTCPIDLEVTDPDGFTITKELGTVAGMSYFEGDWDGNGELDDMILIDYAKTGDYRIHVIPEPGASPTDTFTLRVFGPDSATILAENVSISDIPAEPYIISSTVLALNIPPTTSIEIGEPKRVNDTTYVSPVTPIDFIASDNPYGSGLTSTVYRIYNATFDSGWTEYTQTIYLTGIDFGTYYIDYYSTDYANNTELTNTATVVLRPLLSGDLNLDWTVDIVDIVIVALEFGHPPPPIVDLRADVNKDGLVNIVDIVIVALHFGETG